MTASAPRKIKFSQKWGKINENKKSRRSTVHCRMDAGGGRVYLCYPLPFSFVANHGHTYTFQSNNV